LFLPLCYDWRWYEQIWSNDGMQGRKPKTLAWPAENSPATSVLGSRGDKPCESLGDERNILPSLAGLYEWCALAPSSELLGYFQEKHNDTTQRL
jgi:hypothetical protein